MPSKCVPTVESINQDLRSANIGVSLVQRGSKLSLQATLPPKPDSIKTKPFQQQISLGLYANTEGLQQARAAALDLSSQLARSQFRWQDWISGQPSSSSGATCGDWLERYRKHIIAAHFKLEPGLEDSWWKHCYYPYGLRHLPLEQILTEDLILTATLSSKPDTRMRQLSCETLQRFAKWCGLNVDLSAYLGTYRVKHRQIPSDQQIVTAIDRIEDRQWQWVAAMMATYGLRNHECWYTQLEWDNDPHLGNILVANVLRGKTGPRSGVLPLPQAWADRWKLDEGSPPSLQVEFNRDYGDYSSRYFRSTNAGFRLYDLRHAYAVKGSVTYGIPITVMSAMMGHSVQTHTRTYHYHLNQQHRRDSYRQAIQRQQKFEEHER